MKRREREKGGEGREVERWKKRHNGDEKIKKNEETQITKKTGEYTNEGREATEEEKGSSEHTSSPPLSSAFLKSSFKACPQYRTHLVTAILGKEICVGKDAAAQDGCCKVNKMAVAKSGSSPLGHMLQEKTCKVCDHN